MQLLTLEDWPWAAQFLIVSAQQRANTMQHAVTSGAHLAWCLLAMQPVRAIVGEEKVKQLDKSVDIALMTMPKGGAKAAEFSKVIHGVLVGGGERTTLNLLRSTMGGVPGMGKTDLELAAHGEAIAKLLDQPALPTYLKTPMATETAKALPFLTLGCALAVKLGHRDLTTRHLLVAGVQAFEKTLARAGEASIAQTVTELEALLDGPRGTAGQVNLTPRLAGAVAGALMSPNPVLALVAECIRGDAGVAFAGPVLDDARARLKAKAAAAEPAAPGESGKPDK